MVMRVTENMKYNTTANSIFLSQSKYAELMEQISSQKRINKPSDDPIGARTVLDHKKTKSSIEQYQRNMDNGKGWLDVTETTLNSANDLITRLREIAVGQGSANSSAESRQIAAASVQQMIDQMRTLANTQYGGRYLFAGSRIDTEPFSATERTAAVIDPPEAGSRNTYLGAATQGGAYTGAANNTYVVKITTGGAPGVAVADIYKDGGKTLVASAQPVPAAGVAMALGDGVTLTFGAGTFGANDVFSVQAYAPGYYNGNGEDLAVNVGENATFSYNISGESVFTDQGDGKADIFGVLSDLKTALENNNADGIKGALDGLVRASDSVNLYVSECGTKQNRLELAGNSLSDLNQRMTELISNTEDADTAQVVLEFKQKELALQASYQIASSLSATSILQFLQR